MSPREHAAALLIVRLGSNMIPPRAADADADGVAALLRRWPIGGVILFNGRWPETRATLERLQALSAEGLLVTTDMERGLGQQVAGAGTHPHLAALAAGVAAGRADLDLVRDVAAQSAREALACGVHVTFSPVADVDREPRNPIIGDRAFGADPERAAALVAAFVEGARSAGQLTTAKHFPGHGGTVGDSHAELPTVTDGRDVLERSDLVPFRAAIEAGVDLVMTAHVAVPALDPTGVPATLSAPILRGLLRDTLGFEGAVVTDSLHMAGIKSDDYTEGELAVEMLRAGVDLFVDPEDPEAIIEAIGAAVDAGTLEASRLEAAVARVRALRARLRERFGDDVFRDASAAYPPETVPSRALAASAERAAAAALSTAWGTLPDLQDGAGTLVVALRPQLRPTDPETLPFAEAVVRTLPAAEVVVLSASDPDDRLADVRARVDGARRVVLATVVRPAAWHAFGLAERERSLALHLLAARPSTLVVLGGARGLAGLRSAESALVTYSDAPSSQRAAAAALARGGRPTPAMPSA